ncbi:hypothetical protein AN478_08560 [Thiohalorhabdus denitrificans]|nr:hypothetical protein AN478_08560 [Thiohalorhabdus denitrificans]
MRFGSVTALLAVLLTAGGLAYVQGQGGNEQPGYPVERTVRYGFTVQNLDNRAVETVRFRTLAPVKRTPTQRLEGIEASHPYRLEEDALGNQVLHFTLQDLPPHGQAVVRVTARLRLAREPNPVKKTYPFGELLKPSELAPADHPRIRKLADSLADPESPRATLRGTHRWAVDNIAYEGYIAEDRGALYALENRTGDCTEAMSLSLALLRANEIPSVGVAGFPTSGNSVLSPEDFHNWVAAWPEGEAWVTDPVNERLEEGIPGHIAFRVFSPDEEEAGLSATQSFFRTDQESVSIRMEG